MSEDFFKWREWTVNTLCYVEKLQSLVLLTNFKDQTRILILNVPSCPWSITFAPTEPNPGICILLWRKSFVLLKLSNTTYFLFNLDGLWSKYSCLWNGYILGTHCLFVSQSDCFQYLCNNNHPCILFAGVTESPSISVRPSFHILQRA